MVARVSSQGRKCVTHLWKGAEMVLGANRACGDEVAACSELTYLKTGEVEVDFVRCIGS